jgi:hypothetical protein
MHHLFEKTTENHFPEHITKQGTMHSPMLGERAAAWACLMTCSWLIRATVVVASNAEHTSVGKDRSLGRRRIAKIPVDSPPCSSPLYRNNAKWRQNTFPKRGDKHLKCVTVPRYANGRHAPWQRVLCSCGRLAHRGARDRIPRQIAIDRHHNKNLQALTFDKPRFDELREQGSTEGSHTGMADLT